MDHLAPHCGLPAAETLVVTVVPGSTRQPPIALARRLAVMMLALWKSQADATCEGNAGACTDGQTRRPETTSAWHRSPASFP